MRNRRGVSEVIATILLMAVIATVSFLALNNSSKQTMENEKTVTEALYEKSTQIQELLSVIGHKTNSGKIQLELFNYGLKEIILDGVFVDGKEASFVLSDGSGVVFVNNTFAQKKIMMLETNMTGRSVQLLTNTKNLIDIKIT